MKKQKVGRNQPCPCGSGMKYKRCHGRIIGSQDDGVEQARLGFLLQAAAAREAQRLAQQGNGRPIISTEWNGGRMVAVGSELYFAKGRTFHDFLGEYLKTVLGPEWGNKEIQKPLAERHPVLQWYDSMCRLQRQYGFDGTAVWEFRANGAVAAWLRLAYDLYSMAHNAELQAKLLARLRHPDLFPGARYETYVAAAMIRAGFAIEFEDEDDRRSTHCEFVAISNVTGKRYSVEAKHRNVGDAEGATRFRLGRRLQKALRKNAAYTRIVFLDIGVPDEARDTVVPDFMRQALRDVRRFEGRALHGEPLPPAYLFLTNTPSEHDVEGDVRRTIALAEGFQISDFKVDYVFPSLRAAYAEWRKHIDLHRLLKSMQEHSDVPATFDGEAPELAFADASEPRLRIGERYELPTANGGVANGVLSDAVVIESQGIAVGSYKLDGDTMVQVTSTLSAAELAAYKRHPTTFFGRINRSANQHTDPFDTFLWLLEIHSKTPREILLEWLRTHPEYETSKELPRQDLLELFSEGVAWHMWKDQSKQPQG